MKMGKIGKLGKKRADTAKDSTNRTSNSSLRDLTKSSRGNPLDSANRKKNAESTPTSSLRGARSEASATKQFAEFANEVKQPSNKNQSCEAPKSRPLRGAKNRDKTSSSASADFLLEAEKARALPLKAKSGSFWRVGGAGRGVQPFCEKESEFNLKNGENIVDSANQAKIAESATKSQNLNLDCHDFALQMQGLQASLAMTKKTQKIAESKLKITDSTPKHALDSTPQKLKNPHTQGDIFALQKAIKYHFKDENLLRLALTHKSFDKRTNNERLEFLGDAVMDLIIGEYAFKSLVRCNEGDLTRIRAAIVNENSFANLANRINLGTYLFISHSESRNKGRKKPSILSDAFEALIGAIYLDGGLESARGVALALLEGEYKGVELESLFVDYKTALQELTQAICGDLPEYDLIASKGPDHNKKFTMRVLINAQEFAKATGKSKKEAEQECAKIAYNRIKQRKGGS